jgi:hypothetical protein
VNPAKTPPADWDLLAFGDGSLLSEFSTLPQVADVDLLIVVDGDTFESPWPSPDGSVKSGSLRKWQWQRVSNTSASYEGTKLPDDWGSPRKAVRLQD